MATRYIKSTKVGPSQYMFKSTKVMLNELVGLDLKSFEMQMNVFLRIASKRPDGFHDLASLFHVISLGDKMKFSLSPSKSIDRLSTNLPEIPLDERNFVNEFMLIKEFQLGLGLAVEVVMLQLLFGLQTNSMVTWPLKRNSKTG